MACNESLLGEIAHTPFLSQYSGSENQVSSTTTSGFLGLSLKETETIEEVTMTRLSVGDFTHDFRTLIVPFTAGSTNSA